MGVFRLFATYGAVGVFAIVTATTAGMGILEAGPTGMIWIAISAFMGLMTLILTMGVYRFHLITHT